MLECSQVEKYRSTSLPVYLGYLCVGTHRRMNISTGYLRYLPSYS